MLHEEWTTQASFRSTVVRTHSFSVALSDLFQRLAQAQPRALGDDPRGGLGDRKDLTNLLAHPVLLAAQDQNRALHARQFVRGQSRMIGTLPAPMIRSGVTAFQSTDISRQRSRLSTAVSARVSRQGCRSGIVFPALGQRFADRTRPVSDPTGNQHRRSLRQSLASEVWHQAASILHSCVKSRSISGQPRLCSGYV